MSTTPPLAVAEPMPMSRLLDEAMRLLRANFMTIFPPVAIPVAVISGLFPIGQYLVTRLGRETAGGAMAIPLIVAMVLGMLVFIAVFVLAHGAMVAAAVSAAAGRKPDLAECWTTFLRPRILGTAMLSGLGILAGVACCFLPGFYLMLVWSLTLPVILEEQRFGTDALARSYELTRFNPGGRFGDDPRFRVFLLMVGTWLLGWTLGFIVQIPATVVMMALMIREGAAGNRPDPEAFMGLMTVINVPSQVAGALVQMLTQLFSALGTAVLFFEVRRRKEGGDLEAAIVSLEKAGDTPR